MEDNIMGTEYPMAKCDEKKLADNWKKIDWGRKVKPMTLGHSCGDCKHWMKKSDCPKEKGTMKGGPSCNTPGCDFWESECKS